MLCRYRYFSLWVLLTIGFFNISSISTSGKKLPFKIDKDSLEKINLVGNSSGKRKFNDSADDILSEYADMIAIEDELEIEDEGLVLAHLEKDIENFEDLKKTIAILKNHLNKHADVNVVDSNELVEADHVLKDLDLYMIKPFEQQLKSLKLQIAGLAHKYNEETVAQISSIVENAEMFLEISQEKVEQLEMREQEWEGAEESANIQEMIDLDERTSKIMIEALKPIVTDEMRKKLKLKHIDYMKIPNAYPVRKQGGPILSMDKSLTVAKSMYLKTKRMKMIKSAEKQHADRLKNEHAKISALKQVKNNLETEVLSDLNGKNMSADPVNHYSSGVKQALEAAKESSRGFINEKLHHYASKYTYLPVFLAALSLVIIVLVLVAYRVSRTPGISSRVAMQNFSGVDVESCENSYMELESAKEEDGWGRRWSTWTGHKKNQYKFK